MKLSLLWGMALTALVASAEVPQNYYAPLEGKTKADLKAAAKSVARKHTAISYGENGTWEAFRKTDTRMVDGKAVWWDMYSPDVVYVSQGHPGLNIEHGVPNSWWGGTKNDAYKDLFHLNPSDSQANSWKGFYPLGIVKEVMVTKKGVRYDNGVTKVGKPAAGASGGSPYVFEPADAYKGDFARAYFYMFTIYDDISWKADMDDRNFMFDGSSYPTLTPWAYQLLLEWSRQDPVDKKEAERNEAIYEVQGNRNPFIDCPDLAEHIWGNKMSEPFHYDGTYEPGEPVIPDPDVPDVPDPDVPDVPDPDVPDPNPGVEGDWVAVAPGESPMEGVKYILVSSNANAVMSANIYKNKSGSGYMEQCSEKVAPDASGVIHEIPSDAGIITFTPLASGYALHISSTDGEAKGYIFSQDAKKVDLTDYSTTDGASAKVEVTTQGTTIDYGSAGKLLYNPNSGAERFVTYTSNSMERVRLYRLVATQAPDPEDKFAEVLPAFYALDEEGEEITDGTFGEYCIVEVTLPAEYDDAFVFYTIDGTEPQVKFEDEVPLPATAATREYTSPVEIEESCELRAVGARAGQLSRMATLRLVKDETESVDFIITGDEALEIFTLQGVKLPEGVKPAAGIYIMRRGTKSVKVIVK